MTGRRSPSTALQQPVDSSSLGCNSNRPGPSSLWRQHGTQRGGEGVSLCWGAPQKMGAQQGHVAPQNFSASCLNPWLLCRSTQKLSRCLVETPYDAAESPSLAQKGLNWRTEVHPCPLEAHWCSLEEHRSSAWASHLQVNHVSMDWVWNLSVPHWAVAQSHSWLVSKPLLTV